MPPRNVSRSLSLFLIALALVIVSCRPPDLQIVEFPPQPIGGVGAMPLDGGRVHSIAVSRQNRDEIIISCQFGGLWKTLDGGKKWFHLDSLFAVASRDVAFAPDGRTVVATVASDNGSVNGGGIWVSNDGGMSWSHPATGVPPKSERIPKRISGTGVSFAEDIRGRVYAGTDYGVAVSDDNGTTWRHAVLDPGSDVDGDRMQDTAWSVLALPGDRAIATSRHGVFLKKAGRTAWTMIRVGPFDFGGDRGNSFKMIDVSPLDADQVFILMDYTTMVQYDVSTGGWTTLTLRGGSERGPFVRVSRAPDKPGAIDIWYGAGNLLQRTTRTGNAEIRATKPSDWHALNRDQALHEDTGYLGLDRESLPVLYGSDGGVFRPTNRAATSWTLAATEGSGLNSYQITDLAGTTSTSESGSDAETALYYTTQDNGIWASRNEGESWPTSDCYDGFHIRVRPRTIENRDVTVAYGQVGCPVRLDSAKFSDAILAAQRQVPDDAVGGGTLAGGAEAFPISPGNWVRYRSPQKSPSGVAEIIVSTDNGLHWRRRAEVPLQIGGVFQASVARSGVSVYLPFLGADTPDGRQRIGLIFLPDVVGPGVRTFSGSDLITLPDDGSLGVRATEFDWHAVFAVDPHDPLFIIAPDGNNGVIKVTTDGGKSWATDQGLTKAVSEDGRLLMYLDPWHCQVTHIAFDPDNSNRIAVGTRDAGVFLSFDHAASWFKVPDSELALYVTGFFFKSTEWPLYVSTYGRGLWKIDRVQKKVRPREPHCKPPCGIFHEPWKPGRTSDRPVPNAPVLLLWTELATTGVPVLGRDHLVHLQAIGFTSDNLRILIDGRAIEANVRPHQRGVRADLALPVTFAGGVHRVNVIQETPHGQLRASAEFVNAVIDDFEQRRP